MADVPLVSLETTQKGIPEKVCSHSIGFHGFDRIFIGFSCAWVSSMGFP